MGSPSCSVCYSPTIFRIQRVRISLDPGVQHKACSCTRDCQGARLTWATLPIGGGGRPVDENFTYFQVLKEDGKVFYCAQPFPAREVNLSKFAWMLSVLNLELPGSANTTVPGKLGWLVTLQFPEL